MSRWIEGTVAAKRQWNARLFSLQVSAPELAFSAGQFARLALPAPAGAKEPMLGRPYSFVNPPHSQPHEF
ncbi:MAG TPA: ferredoxin--NADP(+) reductase, partial [Casimicrobiaceae bacterium]|nr:ferredoxin--NADP(+) reductase [Casimicrobiaceae bacterium]